VNKEQIEAHTALDEFINQVKNAWSVSFCAAKGVTGDVADDIIEQMFGQHRSIQGSLQKLRATLAKAGNNGGQGEASEHDAKIIADLEAMAADHSNGFWPSALAIGALRLIRAASPTAPVAGQITGAVQAETDRCARAVANISCPDGLLADGYTLGWNSALRAANDAIRSRPSAESTGTAQAAGWKLVPVELTLEMGNAMNDAEQFPFSTNNKMFWEDVWKAALDAAPHPASAESGGAGEDAKDAARYRWLRKDREVLLLTGFFGNGCINRTIEEVDTHIDAAIAKSAVAERDGKKG